MKTKSLFIAALVVFSAAVSALGKEDPSNVGLAVINVKGTEVYKIVYKGETTGKVKVNIYNTDGNVVFTETLSKVDGFILPLNFNGLQFGEYTVELIDATGKKLEKVSYAPKSKSTKNIHVSKVSGEEGKYIVAVANEGAEVIGVKIYDNANNLIYDKSEEINGDFAKIYAIKNLTVGYTIEVTDKTGYTKTVKL
jgi:hypothetical protein